jgi:hypothetical protein
LISDALYEWGLVLAKRGDRARATERLEEALAIARTGDNIWLGKQCEHSLEEMS